MARKKARKRALIIVDVQKTFCPGSGSGFNELPVPDGNAVVPVINALLDQPYDVKAATRDGHKDPGDHISENPDYITRFPEHGMQGTPGFDFHPGLRIDLFTDTFVKGEHEAAFSGCQAKNASGELLGDCLYAHDIVETDVVGLATDFCVFATAMDLKKQGFNVRVLLKACRGVTSKKTKDAIEEMKAAGIEIIE